MTEQVRIWARGIEDGSVKAEEIPPYDRDAVQIELLLRATAKAKAARAEKLGKAS